MRIAHLTTIDMSLALLLGTIPAWAIQNAWMIDVTALGYPVLCLVLALFPAIYVSMLRRAAKWMPLAIAAPALWWPAGHGAWPGWGNLQCRRSLDLHWSRMVAILSVSLRYRM